MGALVVLAWKVPALLEGERDTWGRWLLRGFWEGAFGLIDLDARGVRTVALGLLGVGAFGGLAVKLLYDVATLPADQWRREGLGCLGECDCACIER